MTENLKALENALYSGRNLEEIVRITCANLMKLGTIDSINRANFLQKYYHISSKERYKKVLESSFRTIVLELKKTSLKNVPFEIAVRIKSLKSLWEKAEKIYQKGRNYEEILDIFGMRIIIQDMDPQNAANILADVANKILDLAISKQWSITPLKRDSNEFDFEKYSELIIPTNDVRPEYLKYVKNYSKYPKENGYQSLHLNVQPSNLFHTEVQIRTWLEHENCEYPYINFNNLDHKSYKAKEYENSILTFRIEDVKAIRIGRSGAILDPYGILKPRIMLVHNHVPF